jgi:hypothetical protein
MAKKEYTPDQIINKLREAEILLIQGATLAVVWKKLGVSQLLLIGNIIWYQNILYQK